MPKQIAYVRRVLSDKDNKWYKYAMTIFKEIDKNCMDKFMNNFVINASMLGLPRERKMAAKYKCNIPWTILFDPTSACNMHCIGCWAAEYGYKNNLTYDEMDKIISQGKDLGIYLYLMTGGEPLVRKDDILKLAEFDPRKYCGPARDLMEEMYKHKILDVLGSDNKLAQLD